MISSLVYRDNKPAAQDPPTDELAALKTDPNVMLWIDLSAPSEAETKLVLESLFNIHPLAIEDCVNDSPLPKLEPYDDYLYFVMHAVDASTPESFKTTEVDFFLGRNFLITYHRQQLKPVADALAHFQRSSSLPVRGPDRFAHTVLDFMFEAYKPPVEALRREVVKIEEGVLHQITAEELFSQVVSLRKQLSRLRQILRPQREVATELTLGKHAFIRPAITPYLRDLVEDLGRLETQTQTYAEQLILAFRLFLNKSSNEANAGIRVLTAITALTFPILLVGGWFGMNFTHMSELGSKLGYPLAFILTLLGTFATYAFMKRRKWL